MLTHKELAAMSAEERHILAEEKRAAGRASAKRADDSFERCDTDGFLSQWANGLGARFSEMEAELIESAGLMVFKGLFNLDAERVRAKVIRTQYGFAWAFCDKDGTFTGKFLGAFPARESTLRRKGYYEDWEQAPAKVVYSGTNACNVTPIFDRADIGYPEDAVDG